MEDDQKKQKEDEIPSDKQEDKDNIEASTPFALLDKTFKRNSEMVEFFRAILTKYSNDPTAENELLKQGHDRASDKIGVGVKEIVVKPHPKFISKCFVIVRTDGSEEDFSYLKCVDNLMEGGEFRKRKREEKQKTPFKPNSCIFIYGIPQDKLDNKVLKPMLNKYGRVIELSLNLFKCDARVMFKNPEQASKALEQLKGDPFSSKLLEGEDEQKFWKKILKKRERKEKFGKDKKHKGESSNKSDDKPNASTPTKPSSTVANSKASPTVNKSPNAKEFNLNNFKLPTQKQTVSRIGPPPQVKGPQSKPKGNK